MTYCPTAGWAAGYYAQATMGARLGAGLLGGASRRMGGGDWLIGMPAQGIDGRGQGLVNDEAQPVRAVGSGDVSR